MRAVGGRAGRLRREGVSEAEADRAGKGSDWPAQEVSGGDHSGWGRSRFERRIAMIGNRSDRDLRESLGSRWKKVGSIRSDGDRCVSSIDSVCREDFGEWVSAKVGNRGFAASPLKIEGDFEICPAIGTGPTFLFPTLVVVAVGLLRAPPDCCSITATVHFEY